MEKLVKIIKSDKFSGLIFLIPGILYLLIFSSYPLGYSIFLSFSNWNIRKPDIPISFAGFSNFIEIIKNEEFLWSLFRTLQFICLSLSVEIILGLLIAILITNKNLKKWVVNIFRSVLVLSIVMTPAVVGILWKTLLIRDYGPVSYFLSLLGIPQINWLADVKMAFFSIVMVEVWQQTTVVILIFISGLMGISKDSIEAGQIDGCTNFGTFRYIILPLLKPIFAIILLLRSMDLLKTFDFIYTMTQGGPGKATEVVNLFIYREGIRYLNFPQAAAASWIVLIVLLPLTLYLILKIFIPKSL